MLNACVLLRERTGGLVLVESEDAVEPVALEATPEDSVPEDEPDLEGMPIEHLPAVVTRECLKEATYRVVCGWAERNPKANVADAEQIKLYLSRSVRNDRIYEVLIELAQENKLFVEKISFVHKGKRCKTMCALVVAKDFEGQTGYFEKDVYQMDDNFFRDTNGKMIDFDPLTDDEPTL